jgi:hypothetical protein
MLPKTTAGRPIRAHEAQGSLHFLALRDRAGAIWGQVCFGPGAKPAAE